MSVKSLECTRAISHSTIVPKNSCCAISVMQVRIMLISALKGRKTVWLNESLDLVKVWVLHRLQSVLSGCLGFLNHTCENSLIGYSFHFLVWSLFKQDPQAHSWERVKSGSYFAYWSQKTNLYRKSPISAHKLRMDVDPYAVLHSEMIPELKIFPDNMPPFSANDLYSYFGGSLLKYIFLLHPQ